MENTTEEGGRHRKPNRRLLAFAVALFVVIAVVASVFFATRTATRPAALDQANQAFTVLYTHNLPRGLRVETQSVRYENGVLFIPVTTDDGRQIVVSQQLLPEKFKQSTGLVGAEKITGTDGPAAVSHVQGHTTATMISSDHKTLVLINDSSNIGSDAVKDLLRSLKPLNQ